VHHSEVRDIERRASCSVDSFFFVFQGTAASLLIPEWKGLLFIPMSENRKNDGLFPQIQPREGIEGIEIGADDLLGVGWWEFSHVRKLHHGTPSGELARRRVRHLPPRHVHQDQGVGVEIRLQGDPLHVFGGGCGLRSGFQATHE